VADPSGRIGEDTHTLEERLGAHIKPVFGAGRHVHKIAFCAEQSDDLGARIDIEKTRSVDERISA